MAKKSNKYVEEWMNILIGLSNEFSTNEYIFKDPYFFSRDVIFPKTDGFNLFMYFYPQNVPV